MAKELLEILSLERVRYWARGDDANGLVFAAKLLIAGLEEGGAEEAEKRFLEPLPRYFAGHAASSKTQLVDRIALAYCDDPQVGLEELLAYFKAKGVIGKTYVRKKD